VNLFSKDPDPYAPIVDFIDAAAESAKISGWLAGLEKEPEHMRRIRLAEIKTAMEFNKAPQAHIEIVELMNNAEVLEAMNKVVADVRRSGMLADKFIRKQAPESFNLLMGLIAATFSEDA